MPDPIAFKIKFEEDSFLIGDSLNQPSFQREIIDKHGIDINSTVLYIPNMKIEESIDDLIEYVSPKILVTGNTIITPNQLRENLSTLSEDIIILETDIDGTITIASDGKKLKVSSFIDEKELVLH